jgi:hypothetical protein
VSAYPADRPTCGLADRSKGGSTAEGLLPREAEAITVPKPRGLIPAHPNNTHSHTHTPALRPHVPHGCLTLCLCFRYAKLGAALAAQLHGDFCWSLCFQVAAACCALHCIMLRVALVAVRPAALRRDAVLRRLPADVHRGATSKAAHHCDCSAAAHDSLACHCRSAANGSTWEHCRSVGSRGWPNADGLLPLVRAAPRRCTPRKCERLALHSQVAAALYVLLPKLHEKRCVLYFDKLHEPKQAKKKTKHYRLSSNRAFHEVMQVGSTY